MSDILKNKYFEWKINLNFISIFDTLEEVVFDEWEDYVAYILAEAEPEKVYLISVGGAVYVTENILEVIYFAEMVCDKILPDLKTFTEPKQFDKFDLDCFQLTINFTVQEYHTFEEAYSVSLNMMEGRSNCYN